MSLDGKRVVVIGESSGIGFAVAELAREVGAEVVHVARVLADSMEAARTDSDVRRQPAWA